MKRRFAAALALASLALTGAAKPVLVPDVSARSIEIRYTFAGAQLLLFGAILYPSGRIPADTPDIVIVVKGPAEPIIVREKQRIAGIWMNADSSRFRSAPSFYAVASSRPIAELVDERTAAIYELGLENLQLSPGTTALPEKAQRFEAGLLDLRRREGLYSQNPDGVEITGGSSTAPQSASPARSPSAPTRPKRSSSTTGACWRLRRARSKLERAASSASSPSPPAAIRFSTGWPPS
jgi:uncharacterized protein (TIGR02186 family)